MVPARPSVSTFGVARTVDRCSHASLPFSENTASTWTSPGASAS
ncbi:Uncharacterised protein [Mycobacteroides abscessus subsp. abscessus]|nr:Uncharacterised protein [Mycobacteroides abscessus subsp. abscessus]